MIIIIIIENVVDYIFKNYSIMNYKLKFKNTHHCFLKSSMDIDV